MSVRHEDCLQPERKRDKQSRESSQFFHQLKISVLTASTLTSPVFVQGLSQDPSPSSPSAGDLRELPGVPLRGEGSCGGGGAPRDSAGSGATEEGLTSRAGRNLRLPLRFGLRRQGPCRVGTGESGLVLSEEWNSACLSSCSGGFRPLVELSVDPAFFSGRCTGLSVPLRVVTSSTGLPSKRIPCIEFLSRADREIGVVRHVAPPTWLVSNFTMRAASS